MVNEDIRNDSFKDSQMELLQSTIMNEAIGSYGATGWPWSANERVVINYRLPTKSNL